MDYFVGLFSYIIALVFSILIFIGLPVAIIWRIVTAVKNRKIELEIKKSEAEKQEYSSPKYDDFTPMSDIEISEIKKIIGYIETTSETKKSYSQAYERKYLMTLNEKSQFRKLQQWAQNRGLIVFSKVRLLDLIQPRKDIQNFKGALWKIQAKHIDFLICDQDIRIKCIIEISDNSHNRSDRIERDKFVTEVLQACGYKVLQTYNVTDSQLDEICGFNKQTANE